MYERVVYLKYVRIDEDNVPISVSKIFSLKFVRWIQKSLRVLLPFWKYCSINSCFAFDDIIITLQFTQSRIKVSYLILDCYKSVLVLDT